MPFQGHALTFHVLVSSCVVCTKSWGSDDDPLGNVTYESIVCRGPREVVPGGHLPQLLVYSLTISTSATDLFVLAGAGNLVPCDEFDGHWKKKRRNDIDAPTWRGHMSRSLRAPAGRRDLVI